MPTSTTSKVHPAPGSQSTTKLKLLLTESIDINGKTYVEEPPNCTDAINLCICPCKPYAAYTAKDETSILYKNACTCCAAPWEAYMKDGSGFKTKIGHTEAPKCCDNGVCFCLCPLLVCTGEIVVQFFKNGNGESKYTVRRDLFPCWPCVLCIGGPCGLCCSCCSDSYAFCTNQNFLVMSEELRGVGKKAPVVGKVNTVDRIECIACCPVRVPQMYSVELNEPDGQDIQLLGLLPLLYKGVPVPCRCCAQPPVPRMTGVKCIDAGRHRSVKYMDSKGMMSVAGAPPMVEMER